MNGLIAYLSSKGKPPSSYNEATGWLDALVQNLYLADQVKWVVAATPSGDFADEWGSYGVPPVAFVIEGNALWYTEDSAGTWTQITQNDSTPTGNIRMSFDTSLLTGYLWLNGDAQVIATYSDLNTYLNNTIGATALRRNILQSAWTSTSQATFSLVRPINNMANSDTINLYWNSGGNSRLGMTLSSVSTSSFVATGGTGDNVPNDITEDFQFAYATTKFLIPDFRNRMVVGAVNLGGTSLGSGTYNASYGIQRGYGGASPAATHKTINYNSDLIEVSYSIKT